MQATVMRHGGSLLVKYYINSLQTHIVLLAPMCQEVLQDNELKKNFLAKAPNGHSVYEQALEICSRRTLKFCEELCNGEYCESSHSR
jgi:hypothetical protein